MTLSLRDELDELEGYVSAVALASGIPVSHVEKDFWVTEALRGIADASQATGCSVIFKGGTSLSKAHRLIQRFSEDVDLLVVLPSGGKKSRDSILKEFAAAAKSETGLQGTTEAATTTTGVKRTVNLHYPARFSSVSLKSDVVMEIGSRGGAIPSTLIKVSSLISEYTASAGLDPDYAENRPVPLLVLDPVRTLVEKLMILHNAAEVGDDGRRRKTVRHYYDVDALLLEPRILAELEKVQVDVLAREVSQHSQAVQLSSSDRPSGGFAASSAWGECPDWLVQAYDDVTQRLVWPTAHTSRLEQCCQRVRDHGQLL